MYMQQYIAVIAICCLIQFALSECIPANLFTINIIISSDVA